MYELKLLENNTGRTWIENYNSKFLLDKRINKLRKSKKIKIISFWEI